MESRIESPRLAVLSADATRQESLAARCQAALPGARIERVRDMVDLMIRAAAGSVDAVVVDGSSGDELPEEGVTVLKGLRANLQVVITDARPGLAVPHRVDQLLDGVGLEAWLAGAFQGAKE